VSFIRTGLRELGLKVRRQRTRMALRHVKRQLQRSEIYLGREGTAQAANFPEVRNEIVALKKLEQEQKEVALRITQIEGRGKANRRRTRGEYACSKRRDQQIGDGEKANPAAARRGQKRPPLFVSASWRVWNHACKQMI